MAISWSETASATLRIYLKNLAEQRVAIRRKAAVILASRVWLDRSTRANLQPARYAEMADEPLIVGPADDDPDRQLRPDA